MPFSFDLLLLERYWIDRPVTYHHTAPILGIYALHEALRSVLTEGLEARWQRHADAAEHLQAAVESRGLELLADADHRLAPLTAVRVPAGLDGKAIQTRVLREHDIEIGGGLGPDAPGDVANRPDGPERHDRDRRPGAGGAGRGPRRGGRARARRLTGSAAVVRRSSPGNTTPKRSISSGIESGCISSP